MKKFRFIILACLLFSLFGCKEPDNKTASNSNQTNVVASNQTPEIKKTEAVNAVNTNTKNPVTTNNSACYNLKRDDLLLDKKQTFAIDFEPFEKSCFVTFHDPEFDNPPLRSEFFIYKDGKEVFSFPEQFGGGNTTCWVGAVSFEDLNNDQLKDVIVVGKCGAKAGSYNENMVYLNNGSEFVTNSISNAETMDFSKTTQIRDFVKKNPTMFSK